MPTAKEIKKQIGYTHSTPLADQMCGNCAFVRIGGPARRPNPKTTECTRHDYLRVARMGRCDEWASNPNPTLEHPPRVGGGSAPSGCWASESKGK